MSKNVHFCFEFIINRISKLEAMEWEKKMSEALDKSGL